MSRPLVLLGDTRSHENVARLRNLGWGRMCVLVRPKPYPGEPWGFDNGAFGNWLRGVPFDGRAYEKRLERAMQVGRPHLAVAPDVVAAGTESLAFSVWWLAWLPTDWPWYLAVQDGMTVADVRPVLGRFAGIFLGGTGRWKAETAPAWLKLARAYGLPCHFARAGTLAKLDYACELGVDSLDSSFPLWTRERFEQFAKRWTYGNPQLRLALGGDAQ